jgi:hypothetical protein
MTTLFSADHEGTGPVDPVAAGYTGQGGAIPTYVTDPAHGATAVLFDGADGFGTLNRFEPGATVQSGYFKLQAATTSNATISNGAIEGAGTIGSIQVQGSGNVRVKDDNGITRSNLGLIAVGIYHRIEHRFFGNGTQQVRVYDADDTTVMYDSGAVQAGAGIPDLFRWGLAALPSGRLLVDSTRLADEWLEPWAATPDPDPAPTGEFEFVMKENGLLVPLSAVEKVAGSLIEVVVEEK